MLLPRINSYNDGNTPTVGKDQPKEIPVDRTGGRNSIRKGRTSLSRVKEKSWRVALAMLVKA